MEAAEILERALELGITLFAEDRSIAARPKGATPPELAETIRYHRAALVAHLRVETEIDRLAMQDGWQPLPRPGDPAYSVLESCRSHGAALRMDDAGDLVVGRLGAEASETTQPWPSLLVALEIHFEAVVRLVEGGWHLRTEFRTAEMV